MALAGLRAEYQVPEARAYLLALLELMHGRVRRVSEYRRYAPSMTLLDGVIVLHIIVLEVVRPGGIKQQSIVDALDAPRRTVRDGLDRLLAAGLVVRENRRYRPTEKALEIFSSGYDADIRIASRLSETFSTFRSAIRR